MKCPMCSGTSRIFYQIAHFPVLQNQMFENQTRARTIARGNIDLAICESCCYCWNSAFEPAMISYDNSYHNEQAFSPFFQEHLKDVYNFLSFVLERQNRIVEIGCGQGRFLDLLANGGYETWGFDPVYEGKRENIVRDYFVPENDKGEYDVIVLRHVLEHIYNPLTFLGGLFPPDKKNVRVYIEVPDLRWIIDNCAYWDIIYEHCNYFSPDFFQRIFPGCQIVKFFGGQYIGVLGEGESFRRRPELNDPCGIAQTMQLANKSNKLRDAIKSLPQPIFLWGAGAKGVSIANLIDPECSIILAIIDINEAKQGKFVAGSGHPVRSPSVLPDHSTGSIIIMNPNYASEIRTSYGGGGLTVKVLGEDL